MDIRYCINFFNDLNVDELSIKKNKNIGSIWFTMTDDDNADIFYGIHCRTHRSHFTLRLYLYENNNRTRITLDNDDGKNTFRATTYTMTDEIISDIVIDDIKNFLISEEFFFQYSLIENLGTLDYESAIKLFNLSNVLKEKSEALLNEC